MVDQPDGNLASPDGVAAQPTSMPTRADGRCDQCGYSLLGLCIAGVCPECGLAYTDQSARRLQPWPSAGMICLKLGWPLAGLALVVAIGQEARSELSSIAMIVLGGTFALAVPANSWWQVRRMLKRSLPEQRRTHGYTFAFRSIGTTICVLLFCAMLLPYIYLLGCLINALNDRVFIG